MDLVLLEWTVTIGFSPCANNSKICIACRLMSQNFALMLVSVGKAVKYAYDSSDPYGNITIKWDFQEIRDDGYTVMVNIFNYQLYRHVETPGWKLGWAWSGEEVIWDIRGAEATEQGAPYRMQTQNCCRGGVLSSMTQDMTKYVASFQMNVGSKDSMRLMPSNFSLAIPGYTCSNASVAPPTKFLSSNTRHQKQALLTWQVICSYSQFRESAKPSCCVSLSTFYNETIVSCPTCSCGCQGHPNRLQCARDGNVPEFLQLPSEPVLMCTQHMCPIRVHWHVKTSYKQYWRVKMTVTNFDLFKNYSDWNLVIRHPNLQSLTQIFSFNYKPLIQYGNINDTGMFWGIKYYNDLLLQQGRSGNVQSEMLLRKDPGVFTFQGGWPFPRNVLFNGHECVMPSPDAYPSLPQGSVAAPSPDCNLSLRSTILFVLSILIFH
ncbi:COBRA-like protein 7 [Asparagus officinalis]|uniref:COBRA-like protein 7 n=1 Tax=Asparagus officinalis TaxID=4686 RepID=UPI00098E634C|nr:COBRA-like protein 7 [Asparagus officinalis]